MAVWFGCWLWSFGVSSCVAADVILDMDIGVFVVSCVRGGGFMVLFYLIG